MKQGVQSLNIIISIFYLATTALVLYIFKKANKPLKNINFAINKIQTTQEAKRLNYKQIIAKSWLKKYTFLGSFLNDDKKYLLKQFFYLSTYAITCLKINKIIIWPICFTLFLTPIFYLCFQYLLKKIHKEKIKQYNGQQTNKNAIKNQIQSELQIQQNIIESLKDQSSKVSSKSNVRNKQINERTLVEVIILGVLTFATIIMYLQTVYTLTNSISNSGQINITSILIIFLIEQLAIRPSLGLIIYGTFKIYSYLRQFEELDQNSWINLLCHQQIAQILIQIQKERVIQSQKRLNEMMLKVQNSPNKEKKPVFNHEKSSYLNLIMQPTKREPQQVVQELFFTEKEQQLFENENKEQNKSSIETKRKNKQNFNVLCHTAVVNKSKEDQEIEIDQISIVKQDILKQHNENYIAEFDINDEKNSPVNYTKRKNLHHKKNKRVLHLTGSSPYLEYLPDMLKKVDKFKQMHPKQTSNATRKIL